MIPNGRRAKIRAPRKNLNLEVDFDASWALLAPAISQIYKKNASQLSFEQLYRTTYTLVLRKHGKQLYEAVSQEVTSLLMFIIESKIRPFINGGMNSSIITNNIEFLREVKIQWIDHCTCMKMISDIMMYLDRVYSKESHKLPIYDVGIEKFRDTFIRGSSKKLGDAIFNTIIEEITKDRNGEIIDKFTIKSLIQMLEALPEVRSDSDSVYASTFEHMLIDSAEKYYTDAAKKTLEDSHDAALYIRKIDAWLEDETRRCKMYLPDSTLHKLLPVIEEVLITRRIRTVLEFAGTGLKFWIENKRVEEIGLVYKLISRVSLEHQDIKELFAEIIDKAGTSVTEKAKHDTEQARIAKVEKNKSKATIMNPTTISINWVDDVLKLKDSYDAILKSALQNDRNIHATIDKAFADFINRNEKVAEYVSLFIDENLKKTLKGKSDQEVEAVLEKAIILFRFISDKDLFEQYYKAHLAKRLLNARSISEDAEKNLIAKIKIEVGTAFTSKLEGMFRDMNVSRDAMTLYNESQKSSDLDDSKRGPVDLSVNVLTSTYWPTTIVNAQTKCVLPSDVEKTRIAFETFYLSRHSGRILSWNYNMGTADVKARFKKRVHEINMPTLCMVILMLFNNVPEGEFLTFEQIQDLTSIPTSELTRHLQSIAVAHTTRILTKEPMSKNIKPTDKFSFNANFESPKLKIRVLAVSSGNKVENDIERKETLQKVEQDRKYETDAAIVRIMKTRKTLDHDSLIAETTKQLMIRFRPTLSLIKYRIDALIETEYLERDPDNRTIYNYLA
ncbi:ubiquitin-protein ligase [Nadsonia fulvescens var. elongata DSM 6958]|uniref:Ubiquitin-protein ligase n=1 Tax=Nadsonia fulvescens var. elongata DSM 6958 TaxID=857566 RepID=A0A1E3PM44_9ASCO|nr:ubiquitin-protein ligase [Nadsonia fulvescens var. elongata DSM 6958]